MAQLNLISFDLLTVPRGLTFLLIEPFFYIESKESWIIKVSIKSRQNDDACLLFI